MSSELGWLSLLPSLLAIVFASLNPPCDSCLTRAVVVLSLSYLIHAIGRFWPICCSGRPW